MRAESGGNDSGADCKADCKYKGPDGLMNDLSFRGWDEQIRARSTLYELTEAAPVKTAGAAD